MFKTATWAANATIFSQNSTNEQNRTKGETWYKSFSQLEKWLENFTHDSCAKAIETNFVSQDNYTYTNWRSMVVILSSEI